jgi:hypothetical protein
MMAGWPAPVQLLLLHAVPRVGVACRRFVLISKPPDTPLSMRHMLGFREALFAAARGYGLPQSQSTAGPASHEMSAGR